MEIRIKFSLESRNRYTARFHGSSKVILETKVKGTYSFGKVLF